MVGVAPPARPAPPAEVRELGTAGRAVARRCEARAEGHRRGRRHRLEGVSAHASPHWRKPPRTGETRPREHSRGGAVGGQVRRHMGYPTPVGRRTLRRVARAAEHRGVADVERRTASGERHDVIDGQVGGGVGGALVARAPVAVLATPGAEHAGAESLPGPRAVERVVPAAVGLPGVLGAATTRAAGDDTTDRAQLHPRIVGGLAGAVYPPVVLRLGASLGRRSAPVEHLEPPVRPVPVGRLEGPRGAERNSFARRQALVAVEFESVGFVQVSGASIGARPIRRPGRLNVASFIDGEPDDGVGIDPWGREGEGVLAVRRPDEASRSRRDEWSEGKFRKISGRAATASPRALGRTPSG